MAKSVLVLGATGPAGLCLLHELVSRQYHIVVYARNPQKVPQELSENNLLTIIEGEISDRERLEEAMRPCSVVLSLLGPNIEQRDIGPSLYADYYTDVICPAMRAVGIRRLIAMGTITISRPEDHFAIFHVIVRGFMRLFSAAIYNNMQNLLHAFDTRLGDLDWTVYRIARLTGESDTATWAEERKGNVFCGSVGENGWTTSISRAVLAKWIVDNIDEHRWYRKMPAVSGLKE